MSYELIKWLLIGTFAAAPNIFGLKNEWVIPRMGFETRQYLYDTRPLYNGVLVTEPRSSYLRVEVGYTMFGFFDVWCAMQGWPLRGSGFRGGVGGGTWGMNLRPTKNMEIGYQHFSCHVFDRSQTCGTEDFVFIRLGINMNGEGKTGLFR